MSDPLGGAYTVRQLGLALMQMARQIEENEHNLAGMTPQQYLQFTGVLLRGIGGDPAAYAAAAYRVGQFFERLAEEADEAKRAAESAAPQRGV